MIDTLAHLYDPRVGQAAPALVQQAFAVGVTDIICGNAPLSATAIRILPVEAGARRPGPRLWRAVGLHPQAVTSAWPQACREIAQAGADVVAVGEVGLDSRPGRPDAALQEAALSAQIDIADALGLPLVVHCVGRSGRLLELLHKRGPPAAGFTLHAFAGPAEMVPQFAELGALFSFGGLVTRPSAKKCHKAAQAVPTDRLLLESDTPDMPPEGRAAGSSPAMLPDIVAALAVLRGVSAASLAHATTQNAQRLYKLAHKQHIQTG